MILGDSSWRQSLSVVGQGFIEKLPEKPYKFGDIEKIRPGDIIHYAVIDFDKKQLQMHHSQVGVVGHALEADVVTRFIEFPGPCKPGFSGGPVMNDEGQVVGIMRESWTKRGIKGGEEIQVNRAYSVELLKTIKQDMIMFTPNRTFIPPGNPDETMSALERARGQQYGGRISSEGEPGAPPDKSSP